MRTVEWGAGMLNSGGSSMNNTMVLPAQTLQSKHYSFPLIHIPSEVFFLLSEYEGEIVRSAAFHFQ